MTSIECHPVAFESREENYQTEPVNATTTTVTTNTMYPKRELAPEVISASSTDWVNIDDLKGVLTESQQIDSSITHDVEELRQVSSASIGQYYDGDGLLDWHDDLTSLITNKRLDFDTDEFSIDADAASPDSVTNYNRSGNWCQLAQDPEIAQPQFASSPRESPISPSPSLLRRTTSGRLWTGIKTDSDQEIEAFVNENDDDDDDWTERKIGHGGRKKEGSFHSFVQSGIDPFSTGTKDSSRDEQKVDSNTNTLKALLNFMSCDNLFGTIPTQDELRVSMVVRKNANAEIGMGLMQQDEEDNAIVIACQRDDDHPIFKMGYKAGMRVVKINDQACPEFLSEVLLKMELRIEAEDESTKTTRVAIIGVHEPNLDLFVHKESERAKAMYITRVEPNSALATAGFKPGMRLTRINGRRCSGSFSGLIDDLTTRIVAVPQDLMVPVGLENKKTLPYSDGSGSVIRERSNSCESRKREPRTPAMEIQSSASLLFDTKKAQWIKKGLMTTLR